MMKKSGNHLPKEKKYPMFTYDLKYSVRHELFKNLDLEEGWRDLASLFNLGHDDIAKLELEDRRRHGQPTDTLFKKFDSTCVRVETLFRALKAIKRYHLMRILKPYVSKKLHKLIPGEDNNNDDFDNKSGGTCNQGSMYNDFNEDDLSSSPWDKGSRSMVSSSDNVGSSSDSSCGFSSNSSTNDIGKEMKQKNQPTENSCNESINVVISENTIDRPVLAGMSDLNMTLALIPHYSYDEILKFTNNFSDKNLLGTGAFSRVYQMYDDKRKQTYALKRMIEPVLGYAKSNEHFKREVVTMYKLPNANLARLMGICFGNENCLVYELYENGSLDDRLRCRNGTLPLAWMQRVNIMEGSAKGLLFLHTQSPAIIHRDLKSANILLDHQMNPRLADFGLANNMSRNNLEVTHITVPHDQRAGTEGYMSYEYLQSGKASTASDVFAFGVILAETVTGRRPAQVAGKTLAQEILCAGFATMKNMKDPNIGEPCEFSIEEYLEICQLAHKCVDDLKKCRPTINEIYDCLEKIQRKCKDRSQGYPISPGPDCETSIPSPYQIQLNFDRGVTQGSYGQNLSLPRELGMKASGLDSGPYPGEYVGPYPEEFDEPYSHREEHISYFAEPSVAPECGFESEEEELSTPLYPVEEVQKKKKLPSAFDSLKI